MIPFKAFYESNDSETISTILAAVYRLRDIIRQPTPQRENNLNQTLLQYAFDTEFDLDDIGYVIRDMESKGHLMDHEAEYLIDKINELEERMPKNYYR